MVRIGVQLKQWFSQNRDMGRNDDIGESEPSDALLELPLEATQQLRQLAMTHPQYPSEEQVIQETISSTVQQWQTDPNVTSNSLVILNNPVSAITSSLTDKLAVWAAQNSLAINILNWVERPIGAEQIQEQMSKALSRSDLTSRDPQIAVIPNLSRCFLRSAEGLDGIDFLRDQLLNDQAQFWVIGSSQISWQYLNSVLKLKAHCGDVIQLPHLSGEQIKTWLMPIVEKLSIELDQSSIYERLQDVGESRSHSTPFEALTAIWGEMMTALKSRLKLSSQKSPSLPNLKGCSNTEWENYFEYLARISEGVSTIALQLFIRSIYYREIDACDSQDSSGPLRSEAQKLTLDTELLPPCQLVAQLPMLPELPVLEQDKLYVLFSLLVHEDLTLNALAESLGEDVSIINAQVQFLLKAGLIEKKGKAVTINPIHYPRLKTALASNNFIVEVLDD